MNTMKIAGASLVLLATAGMGIPAQASEPSALIDAPSISHTQLATQDHHKLLPVSHSQLANSSGSEENVATQQQQAASNVAKTLATTLGIAVTTWWGLLALKRRFRENCEF